MARVIDMSKAHAKIMDSFITAFENVLDQIEEQCAVDASPEWVSTEERLPAKYQAVIGYCVTGTFDVFKWDYEEGAWVKNSGYAYLKKFVTHWHPLPVAPKGCDCK